MSRNARPKDAHTTAIILHNLNLSMSKSSYVVRNRDFC